MRISFLGLILLVAASGCARHEEKSAQRGSATPHIEALFSIAATPGPLFTGVDRARITLARTALGVELLLRSIITQQSGTSPKFYTLKSRIVRFELRADRLFLFENESEHRAEQEIALPVIITEFPILTSNDASITFDFARGMSRILTDTEWRSTPGTYTDPFTSSDSRITFIERALFTDEGALEIRQFAQIGASPGAAGVLETIQVDYAFEPYAPSEGFSPSLASTSPLVRYFINHPHYEGDNLVSHATKIDTRRPFLFEISSSTPVEYRQSVRDGVNYWNSVFGRQVLQVIDAPEGVTAPSLSHNLIQWVSNNTATGAYADAQSDPRTGQTTHAQIFFSSVFTFSSRSDLVRILNFRPTASATRATLSGFETAQLCNHEGYGEELSASQALPHLPLLTDPRFNEEALLRYSQDLVRVLIAHEVGHTLGLRHNFAGSLGINVTRARYREILDGYLANDQVPTDLVLTSTVMDYYPNAADALIGAQIRKGAAPLTHDVVAINALYKNITPELATTPAFCTDNAAGGNDLDCMSFDMGANVVERLVDAKSYKTESIHAEFIMNYISLSKAPLPGTQAIPVAEVQVSVNYLAEGLLTHQTMLTRLLSTNTNSHLLSVRRLFPYISLDLEDQVRRAEGDSISALLSPFGGVGAVLAPLPADITDGIFNRFTAVLDSPILNAESALHAAYAFTEQEQIIMRRNFRSALDRLPEILIRKDIESLKPTGSYWEDHPLTSDLANVIESRMREYLMAVETTGQFQATVPVSTSATETVAINLPRFKYSHNIRKAAASLLSSSNGKISTWSIEQKSRIKSEYLNLIKTALGGRDTYSFQTDRMPAEVRLWLAQQAEVTIL